ncbi:hypothetical protein V491_07219 [Pseudogymnoascus sp. VKM F-3775]|nr:hypothetical protein V491_07219 [Pseudogymnoascus sp. VKM F-3775]
MIFSQGVMFSDGNPSLELSGRSVQACNEINCPISSKSQPLKASIPFCSTHNLLHLRSAKDKLIISQIITAANYEYGFYHIFHLDGTYQLEVKLTGILNTYPLHPSEKAAPYGTEVARRVTAHNHQHIFSLRIDSEIDGPNNTVVQCDAVAADDPVGSSGNYYGNAFYSKKSPLRTSKQGAAEYCHETNRTWDIVNSNVVHLAAKEPVSYKIVSRESPPLLAKPGSIVWKRAGFARKTLWVTPYRDYELFPAGNYIRGDPDMPVMRR